MSVKLNRDQAKALGLDAPPRPNKFHAVRTEYNFRRYDSKAEARHAMELDMLGFHWTPQPVFHLGESASVYVADFLIKDKFGRPIAVHEVKGRRTSKFNRDRKLWSRYGPLKLYIYHDGKLEETVVPEREP